MTKNRNDIDILVRIKTSFQFILTILSIPHDYILPMDRHLSFLRNDLIYYEIEIYIYELSISARLD